MPVVATNTAANTALRYLNENARMQGESIGKLSSGSRIENAADDAAGLAVGTRIRSDVTTLTQNAVNAANGIALVQVADGALSNISDILQRMKSLTAQSITGSISNTERGFINAEYQQLLTEIDAIVGSTRFNNSVLLDGTFNQGFLVGTNGAAAAAATDRITVALGDFRTTALGPPGFIAGTSVTTVANAETATVRIDAAINQISTGRATTGSLLSRFQFRADVIATSTENLQASQSAIMDVDIAAEQTRFVNAQTLTDAAIASLAQANQLTSRLIDLIRG